jgi:plasmid stabilization system protein ParE
MSLPSVFRRSAKIEFIEAASWYENKRSGLGLEFISEIERCIALAAEDPSRYASVHRDIRRVVANRFPFSVYFRAEETRIVVLAVFHGRRNPAIWRTRT